jgi:hypothetical protein
MRLPLIFKIFSQGVQKELGSYSDPNQRMHFLVALFA